MQKQLSRLSGTSWTATKGGPLKTYIDSLRSWEGVLSFPAERRKHCVFDRLGRFKTRQRSLPTLGCGRSSSKRLHLLLCTWSQGLGQDVEQSMDKLTWSTCGWAGRNLNHVAELPAPKVRGPALCNLQSLRVDLGWLSLDNSGQLYKREAAENHQQSAWQKSEWLPWPGGAI